MRPSVIRAASMVVLAAVLAVLLAAGIAGCSSPGMTPAAAETPYCADAQGQVYPPSYCDGGNPLFWYWLGAWGGHHYGYGQVIHVTNIHVTRVRSTDRAARARYGMPATGRVTSSYRYTPPRSTTTRTSTSVKTPGGSTVKTRTSTTTRTGGGFLGGGRLGGGRSSFGGRR